MLTMLSWYNTFINKQKNVLMMVFSFILRPCSLDESIDLTSEGLINIAIMKPYIF